MAPSPAPDTLLKQADALRDARDWARAAAAYGAYLALRPNDAGIMVQRGHCVKEAGNPAAALALYRRAAALAPQDADIRLQIGHACKLLGRAAEAQAAYSRALALAPEDEAAWRELSGALRLAASGPAANGAVPPAEPIAAVAIDLSDLVAWIARRRLPSGIQRVQLGVAEAGLRQEPPTLLLALPPEREEAPRPTGWRANGWREVPAGLLVRIAALMRAGGHVDDTAWQQATGLLEDWLAVAPPVALPAGTMLFDPGTAWSRPRHADALRQARRAGLRHAPLLHDCGPLVMPHLAEERLVRDYARWFARTLALADGIVTYSATTAADLAWLAGEGALGPLPPVTTVPLAAADPPAPPAEAPPLPRAAREGFVLWVATLEARKNHMMVFAAWNALIRRHGIEAVPNLICVGRVGPGAAPALAMRQTSPALTRRVTILSDVSDPLLRALYGRCLFTIYNSELEGWGLPVSESLAHGKVPLVPAHSALRESGGEAAVYFEPNDDRSLLERLEALIFDADFRAAANAAAAAAPRPRPWAEVGEALLAAAAAFPARTAPEPALPLRARLPVRLIDSQAPLPEMALAVTLRAPGEWHPLEANGSWSLPGPARLRLPLAGPAPRAMLLYLEVAAPAEAEAPLAIALRDLHDETDQVTERSLAPSDRGVWSLPVIAADGVIAVEIEAPETLLADGRPVGVLLGGVLACPEGDVAGRLDYLEGRMFRRAVPEGAVDPLAR
jgi:glycosyltransferase involved in cell wall biosynthesis